MEVDAVKLDHSYCKLWLSTHSAPVIRPTKYLFSDYNKTSSNEEDEIDVDTVPKKSNPVHYDQAKAMQFMNECSNFADVVRVLDDKSDGNWEDSVDRNDWTKHQNKLFDKVCGILQADHLARLALSGRSNEAIFRRIHVDRAAAKFRHACAAFYWETSLVQWLHSKLIEYLSRSYLVSYLDILQTLRCKIPSLIDKLFIGPSNTQGNSTNPASLSVLLKRPWDPSGYSTHPQRPVVTMKRLVNGPFVFIIPAYPVQIATQKYAQRMKVWNANLTALGKACVIATPGVTCNLNHYVEDVVLVTRSKIQECRSKNQNRPIILIGWGTGALIALTVASGDPCLTGVVCLGFPSFSVTGKRGEPDDYLLANKVPVLFVIGQKSSLTNLDEIESMRERMKCDSSVVVVPGADDFLCVSFERKLAENLTQPMIDSFIMDEVYEFLSSLLTSNYSGAPSHYFSSASHEAEEQKKVLKMDLKRKLEADNSDHWRKVSPVTPKLGRPPGSSSSSSLTSDIEKEIVRNPGKIVLSGMPKYLKVGPAMSTSCPVGKWGAPSPLFVNDCDSPGIKIANVTSRGRLPIKLQVHPENPCNSVVFTPFRGSTLVKQGSVTATKYTFPVDHSEGSEGADSVPVRETMEVLRATADTFKVELKSEGVSPPKTTSSSSTMMLNIPTQSLVGPKKILTAVSQATRMTSSFVFVPSTAGSVVQTTALMPGFVLLTDSKKGRTVKPPGQTKQGTHSIIIRKNNQ